VITAVNEMQQYLNTSRTAVDERFKNLEKACTHTAKQITDQFDSKCKEYFAILSTFKRDQDAQSKRLKEVEAAARTGPTALSLAQALQKRLKTMGTHVADLEAKNKILTEALAKRALTPTTQALQDANILSQVDKKVATVNDRVSEAVSRFEAFINKNAKQTLTSTPT
jgi:hypothetical protein